MLRALFILGVTSSTLGCIFPSAGGCGCGGGGGCAAPAPLPPPPPPPPPPAPICPPPSLCLPPICPPTCQPRAPSCGGGGCGAAPSCGGGSCGGGGGGGGCSGGSGCGGGGGGYVAPAPLPFLGGPIGGGGGYAPQPQPFIPSGGYAAPVQQQPAQELVSTYSETPAAWPQQAPQQAPVANYAPQQVPQQAPAANYAPQQGSQSVSSISTAAEETELHAQNNQAPSGAGAHAQNNMAGSDVDEHDDLTSDSESQSPDPPNDPPNEESEIVLSHESEGTIEQSLVQPSSQEIEVGHFDVTTSTSTHPTLRPDPDEESNSQYGNELTEEHEISTTVRAATHDELGDYENIEESLISTTVIPPIREVPNAEDGNALSEEHVISTTVSATVPFRELSNSEDYEELNEEQEVSTTRLPVPAAEHHQATVESTEHELNEEQEVSATTSPAAEHHQATEHPTTQHPFDALEQSVSHNEIVHKLRDDTRYHEVRTTTEVPPRNVENAGYSSQLASEEEDTDERLRTQLDEISDLAAALGEKPNNQLNDRESEFEVKEIISDVLRRRKLLLKRKRPLDLDEGELPTYYSETYQQIAPAVRTQEINSYSQGSGVAAGSTVQEVAERSAPSDDEDDRDSSAYKEEANEQTKIENTREAKPAKSAEQRDDRVSEVSETQKEPSPALSDDPLCNNDDLRKLMIENMDNNLNASKRLIQLAAESKFGGRFDVICANGDFSYVTNTELYCQESKADVSCYSYRQLS